MMNYEGVDGPATTGELTEEKIEQHIGNTAIVEVHEPVLPLTQGSWLRCSRENVTPLLREIIRNAPGNVRLTVRDSVTAASLRRRE